MLKVMLLKCYSCILLISDSYCLIFIISHHFVVGYVFLRGGKKVVFYCIGKLSASWIPIVLRKAASKQLTIEATELKRKF